MPKKPTSFDDIVGHKNLVEFLKDHLSKGTLPQFIILEGDEGLGKSSLAKILALELMNRDPQVLKRVIQENRSKRKNSRRLVRVKCLCQTIRV